MKANGDRRDRSRLGKEGMTLIELMLVVVILGILAAVIVPQIGGKGEKARIGACRASIAGLGTAIDNYEVDTGRYPNDLRALNQNDGSPNWDGPYVKQFPIVDPWGNEFGFKKEGDKDYEIRSAGPDSNMGSGDDITN